MSWFSLVVDFSDFRNYREENDPDYELPESDRVWESDVEEEEAEEEDIVAILVREAEEPLPDIQELEEEG